MDPKHSAVIRWFSIQKPPEAWLAQYLTCKQKVVGSNPTLGRYFSTHVYFNGNKEKSYLRLKGYVDPRACGCGVWEGM